MVSKTECQFDDTLLHCPIARIHLSVARLGYTRCGGAARVPEKRVRFTAGAGPTPLGMYLVMQSEGFVPKVYKDAAGWATIGYGHLVSKSTDKIPKSIKAMGVDIDVSDKITPVQAFLMLAQDMAKTNATIDELITQPLSPGQHAALESLVFSIGPLAFRKSSALKHINENRLDLVPADMSRFVTLSGRPIPGLQRRRDLEIGMWLMPTD